MNTTTTRRLASVLTVAATAVAGLVGARAIDDNDASSADVDGDDAVAAVLIEGELDDVQQPIPLLGPISDCLLYTSPSPRDRTRSRMPSSA